jgi:hypothetical protein
MTQRSKQTEQITDAETTTNVENETEREIAKYLSEDTVDDGEWLQSRLTFVSMVRPCVLTWDVCCFFY